jgi:hypothetical protein
MEGASAAASPAAEAHADTSTALDPPSAGAGGRGWATTLVYQSPLTRSVRMLKRVSLFSTSLAALQAPVMVLVASTDPVKAFLVSGMVLMLTGLSTGVLHLATRGFVAEARMLRDEGPGKEVLELQTLSLTGRPRTVHVLPSDIGAPSMPLATFRASGRNFFVDPSAAKEDFAARLDAVAEQVRESSQQL